MKKAITLLIALLMLGAVVLYAQETDETVAERRAQRREDRLLRRAGRVVLPSHGLLSLYYNYNYFAETKDVADGFGVNLKLPVDNSFGVAVGLSTYARPVTAYDVGTATNYTGEGLEKFTDINLSLIYYFWFLKELQFKFGFGHQRWVTGEMVVDPTTTTAGSLVTMHRTSRGNLFYINLGVNFEVPIIEKINLISGLGYKYAITDGSSALCVDIGIGYKLSPKE